MRTLDKNNFLRTLSRTCACILLAATFDAAADARSTTYQLDIPAQSLSDALQALALASQHKLLYDTVLVKGKSSPALKGDFTAEEAVKRLLSGTNLSYEVTEDGLVLIRPPSAPARSSASRAPDVGGLQWASASSASPSQAEGVQRADADGRTEEASKGANAYASGIQEIIVTATKRSENIQNVPMSIAVVSAHEIDRRGLLNAEDYLRGIPGANQMTGRLGQSIVIRGIETATASQNFASGTTTATYFGETPTTNAAGLLGGTNIDLKLVDIERVEVLRGPQGTAFGSSSMGGAVRTIPVAPKLNRFEAKGAASYSLTSGSGDDNYNLQAVGNASLIQDKLAIRAVAYQYEDSGFYRNVAGSDPAFRTAVVDRFGAQAFAVDEEQVGSYYVRGGRISALLQAHDDLKFTLSYLSQKTETDGIAGASSGTYEQTILQVAPEHVVRGQTGGVYDTDIDLANAVMEYDFGAAKLLATYSHIESGSISSTPYGGYGTNRPVSDNYDNDHREQVGEIRLATQLEGAWNFLAGVYAEDVADKGFFDNVWHGDPATNIFYGVNPPRHIGVRDDRRTLKQKAAFGEASWELLEGLTLTGGVRAYEFDRTFLVDTTGPVYGVLHRDVTTGASGENFRANLNYKPEEDVLVYAGWSQGFRLGQLQLGLPPGSCDLNGDGIVDGTSVTIEATRRVNSDYVDNYEVGAKFALLDRRLTIASDAFRMEWSDVPVRVLPPSSGGCRLAYVANAGKARSEGVELQASYQLTKAFRLEAGGSWIHARLTEDVPALRAPKGNRLPGSPKVNANLGLQYEFDIRGHNASVRADSIYVGSFYADLLESPNTSSGGYVKVDTSARVQVGSLSVDLYVRNLTNEDAYTFRGFNVGESFGYRLRPRTVGLQLGYAF